VKRFRSSQHLSNILGETGIRDVKRIITEFSFEKNFNLVFSIPDLQFFQYRSILFKDDTTYTLICEKIFPESSDILDKYAVLTNEIADLSRELKRKNRKLLNSERELTKNIEQLDLLMHEMNHRIKNNLNTISSIVGLKAMQSESEEIQEFSTFIQNRLMTIALIHEKLYKSNSYDIVELNNFISDLLKNTSEVYGFDISKIELKFIFTPIQVSSNTAVTIGLIINELISNTIKHAFKNSEKNREIIIESSIKEKMYSIEYHDNGKGFDNTDITKTDSLGLSLVRNQIEQILKGSIKIYSEKGYNATIEIPLETIKTKHAQ